MFPFAAEQTHLRLHWELLLLLPFTGAASFSFGASGFGLLFGDLYRFASAAQFGLNMWVLELVTQLLFLVFVVVLILRREVL